MTEYKSITKGAVLVPIRRYYGIHRDIIREGVYISTFINVPDWEAREEMVKRKQYPKLRLWK